jgi:hypothetical protein
MKPKKPATYPWSPTPYDDEDIRAIRALFAGNASDGQQRRAVSWIINGASGYYDLSFRPGIDGARATDFCEGRRFVGAQMIKLSKLTPQT